MKKFILPLLLVIIAFASCENIESNSPSMQGEVDSSFFKANTALITVGPDGEYLIQGISYSEAITLRLSSVSEGSYALGGFSANYATYEDLEGNVYTTTPTAEGTVTISGTNAAGDITGSFGFTAIRPGVDTVRVSRGTFFEVPFSVLSDPGDDDDSNNDGTLGATVNTVPFNPITVAAVNTGNSIIIQALTASNSILLRMPITVEVGNYSLPMGGFQATYTEGTNTSEATQGSITVSAHDMAAGTISGTFNFVAGSNEVNSGQFSVTY